MHASQSDRVYYAVVDVVVAMGDIGEGFLVWEAVERSEPVNEVLQYLINVQRTARSGVETVSCTEVRRICLEIERGWSSHN